MKYLQPVIRELTKSDAFIEYAAKQYRFFYGTTGESFYHFLLRVAETYGWSYVDFDEAV